MITFWLHFSEIIASPGNGQQDVATKQHAREQGQQQDGDIKAIAPLADDDAREDEHSSQEKDVFRCECHNAKSVV